MSDVIKLSDSFAEYYAYIDGIDTIDEQTMELIQQVYTLQPFEYTNGDCIQIVENLIQNFHIWHKLDAGDTNWQEIEGNSLELAYVVRLNGKGKGSIEYIPANEYKGEGNERAN